VESTCNDHHVRYSVWPTLAVTAVGVALIAYVAVLLNRQVSEEMLDRYLREQQIAVSQQAERLVVEIEGIERDLVHLSRNDDFLSKDRTIVRRLLREFYERHQYFLSSGVLVNDQCVIVCEEGEDRAGEGMEIGGQAHVKKVVETLKPVVSGSFRAVQGFWAIAIHAPIVRDGAFMGSVATTVKWDGFEAWGRKAKTSPGSFSIILDPTGKVIYHPDPGHLGKAFKKLPAITRDGARLDRSAITNGQSAIVNGPLLGDEEHILVSWPFEIEGEAYTLATCAPYEDIVAPLRHFSRLLALLLGLAFLFIAGGVAFISLLFYRDKQRVLAIRAATEDKLAEVRKAQVGLHLYKEIFDKSQDGIAVIGSDGLYRDHNEAHRSLFGYSLDELRTRTPEIHAGRAGGQAILEGLRETGAFRGEIVSTTGAGEKRNIDLSAFTVATYAGAEVYHVGITRDITRRKQGEMEKLHLEEQLRQSEKLQAIGLLAGGIAHDFNNQLTGILGYGDLLCHTLDDPDHRAAAEQIVAASQRAANLTAQLLAYARKGKHQSAPVDIHEVVGEAVELLKRSIDKRIRLLLRLDARHRTVVGDPNQIEDAVLNLAINARDAMPEGGELTFLTKEVDLDQAECLRIGAEMVPGRYVQLSVRDTGVGIDASIRDRVFEPFFTTKPAGEGSGMGLAAVYGTVTSHRGGIEVLETEGGGATFVISLPAENIDEDEVGETEAAASSNGAARVLVVEDETVVRELAVTLLRSLGYEVITCRDGLECVELFQRESADIDIVLLDLLMPEMGGRDAFIRMKEIDPDVKVVVCTGFSIEGEAQEILDRGGAALIQKPFRRHELSRVFSEVLRDDASSGDDRDPG
jgi:PAS domain S-box-containing protein